MEYFPGPRPHRFYSKIFKKKNMKNQWFSRFFLENLRITSVGPRSHRFYSKLFKKNHKKNICSRFFLENLRIKAVYLARFSDFIRTKNPCFSRVFLENLRIKSVGSRIPQILFEAFQEKINEKKNICSRFFLENLRIKANNSVFLNILWVIRNEDLQFVAEEEEEELEDPNIYLKLRQDPITRVGELNSYSPNTLTIII